MTIPLFKIARFCQLQIMKPLIAREGERMRQRACWLRIEISRPSRKDKITGDKVTRGSGVSGQWSF
jgi:hypothetical protein